jgi:hypothetical protein
MRKIHFFLVLIFLFASSIAKAGIAHDSWCLIKNLASQVDNATGFKTLRKYFINNLKNHTHESLMQRLVHFYQFWRGQKKPLLLLDNARVYNNDFTQILTDISTLANKNKIADEEISKIVEAIALDLSSTQLQELFSLLRNEKVRLQFSSYDFIQYLEKRGVDLSVFNTGTSPIKSSVRLLEHTDLRSLARAVGSATSLYEKMPPGEYFSSVFSEVRSLASAKKYDDLILTLQDLAAPLEDGEIETLLNYCGDMRVQFNDLPINFFTKVFKKSDLSLRDLSLNNKISFHLEITQVDDWSTFQEMLTSSEVWLGNVQSLSIKDVEIGDAGATTLANSLHLTGLTALDLTSNRIGDTGAAALAASSNFQGLTTLKLSKNAIGNAGATALANSPHLTSLKALDLGDNRIGADGAAALANSPHLTSLTTLKLWQNNIRDAGAAALAASPHLASLTTLDLAGNIIGADGADALAASPHLTSLTTLDLYLNNIGDVGAAALKNSPYLQNCKISF